MAQRQKLMALMERLELVKMGFGSLCMVAMKAQIILEYGLQSLMVSFSYCLWNLSFRLGFPIACDICAAQLAIAKHYYSSMQA